MLIETALRERQERALRIDNALRDNSIQNLMILHSLGCLDGPPEAIRAFFSRSSGLISFLSAALLIRKNYQTWIQYLDNISEPPPAVFESFAENRKLVIFLFICQIFNVFQLNPEYSFLKGYQKGSDKVFIHGERIELEKKVKPIVELWFSLGTPEIGKSTFWPEACADLKENPRAYGALMPLGMYFYEMSEDFCLDNIVHDVGYCKEEIRFLFFEINEFVREASIALSFDRNNVLLETIHELFPQYPELVSDICCEYYLATTYDTGPSYKGCPSYEDSTGYLSATEHTRDYQSVLKILEKEMNCKIDYNCNIKENDIYHKGVRNMFRIYPHLFARWDSDPKLALAKRQLTGTNSAIQTRWWNNDLLI